MENFEKNVFYIRGSLLSVSLMHKHLKEMTVHTGIKKISAPFVYLYLLHWLFFPPAGTTQPDDHVTSHPWGLVDLNDGCNNKVIEV